MKKAIFQQDIAAPTEKWFQDVEIELLSRPASSADLNPIKNLWEILGRKVYNQEKSPIENIAEFRKKDKIRMSAY